MKIAVEDLIVWQRSMNLAVRIHGVVLSQAFRQDWDFRGQMRRASTSVPFNLSEGYEKGTIRDAVKFYYIAKGSAGELRTQCVLAGRIGYLSKEEAMALSGECTEVARMIMGLIRSTTERANFQPNKTK